MRAYYYDNVPGDQRLPHDYNPSRPVAQELLAALNVKFWSIPVEGYESKVDDLAKERGYKNRDMINVSKEGLGEVGRSRACVRSPPTFLADLRGEDQGLFPGVRPFLVVTRERHSKLILGICMRMKRSVTFYPGVDSLTFVVCNGPVRYGAATLNLVDRNPYGRMDPSCSRAWRSPYHTCWYLPPLHSRRGEQRQSTTPLPGEPPARLIGDSASFSRIG